jgi:sulfhydrogenase subunit gamma (sulfur reductase)
MRAGEVTKALHNLSEGDKVGIRAPMGCGFPLEAWKGKRILYVLGGIGSAALKSSLQNDAPPSGTRRASARQGRKERQ